MSEKDTILKEIANRYNPVGFGEGEVAKEDLEAILKATTMAPSAFGEQPWRFYIAIEQAEREMLLSYMTPGNALWAKDAPVLIAVAGYIYGTSDRTFNYWSGFDSGAAWGYMALEAMRRGYAVGFIGGFDRNDIKREFVLDDEDFYDFYAIVAIGKPSKDEVYAPLTAKPIAEVLLKRKK